MFMAEDYFDRATIQVRAGTGGSGAATFRREKFVPRGGPNGGDGGRGGNLYLVADPDLNTLLSFRYERTFAAENGGNGQKNNMRGRQGRDMEIRVPPGTVVRATIDGVLYEVDLARPGQRLLAARGGRGGLGNVHFTTSVRQAPRIAEIGEPGQELELELELKLIADVGLVGFPNAGKSTLLSVISAARPKIANYPFTTLQPNLGIVDIGTRDRFVVADIPGLIEGAHAGVGLGHDFLRHVERTRVLIHVVDAAGVDFRDPADDFRQINEELRLYRPELADQPQVIALNKMDLPEARANLDRLRRDLPVAPGDLFPIAAATREGVDPLLRRVAELLREQPAPAREPVEPDEPPLTWPVPQVDENAFTIEPERGGWRVRGVKLERLVRMTNFAQPESVDRVQRVLDASGVSQALLDAGLQEGDLVYIGNAELEWDSQRFE
jgi:GTP-binding protein